MTLDSRASNGSSSERERRTTDTVETEFLPTDADPSLRRPGVAWTVLPLRGRGLALLFAGWISLSAVTTGLGLAIVEWWEGSDLAEADADINRWWAARRTPWLDELAELGSAFSDTRTIIVVGLALIPLLLWWFGRWHEVALIVGVMVLETTVYLVPSRLVGRERPPVDQVAGPANDHSFPSGHVAAAIVFYGALAVIVTWHATQPWAHTTWRVIVFAVPIWVAWSRVYIGAHHVTDFVGSLVIGVGVVVVVTASIRSHDSIGPPDAIVTDRADDPRGSTSVLVGGVTESRRGRDCPSRR